MSALDEKYMRLCFELAKKGSGFVSPNPLVGAVIVKEGEIVSTGYHQKFGESHAEKNAIGAAKENLTGATLYCNLEPCVHTDKQTPPCVPAIIESGIKKVVISNVDTNPKVNGQGIQKLAEAGVEVVSNILEEEGRELNRFFFKYVETGLPYVTMKIATSLDGKITAAEGTQTWLTCEESKKFVHNQRSAYDAVLVGANTVNIDNPQLTVRSVKGRNPIRIILDGNLRSRIESETFNSNESRTLILCSVKSDESSKKEFSEKGIEVFEFESGMENKLNLHSVLQKLSELKITSLFVEGGGQVFGQFITQRLFDEIIVLEAPVVLNSGVEAVPIDEENSFLVHKEKVGKDTLLIYKPKEAEHVHRNN